MTELNEIPSNASLEVVESDDVTQMLIEESHSNDYDLILIGASEETYTTGSVFGYKVDRVIEQAACSVLVLHQHEAPAASWLRRQLKRKGNNIPKYNALFQVSLTSFLFSGMIHKL